ncbi:MAG: hypothetical protein GX605_02150 [Chloroflexi bacterium]|nr:hypothetical protein [Chloroflexota bacterium]
MVQKKHWFNLLVLALLAAAMAACGPGATPAPTAPTTYDDPFAYCAAVGNIDEADTRYVGEKVPQTLAEALKTASGASADAPLDMFLNGSAWRCMDGKVYGCVIGANIPCWSKADANRTPSEGSVQFCKEQPNAEGIPAFATGRETVYSWRCKEGMPEVVEQVLQVDARGYQADFWYPLNP